MKRLSLLALVLLAGAAHAEFDHVAFHKIQHEVYCVAIAQQTQHQVTEQQQLDAFNIAYSDYMAFMRSQDFTSSWSPNQFVKDWSVMYGEQVKNAELTYKPDASLQIWNSAACDGVKK
ncbi:hypothetical protein ACJJVG_08885 [Pseudocitrobacter faecalis]|uniref:hypothetical protein n=1 Tax=Pseudocitrobacter faecalis TaxID=1398493 RepID=UPI00389A0ADC